MRPLPILRNLRIDLPFFRQAETPLPAPRLPAGKDSLRLSSRDDLREQLQRQLDVEIGQSTAAGIKTLVRRRPDLIDAASPEQRAQLIGLLLGKPGSSPDREGVGLVLAPAPAKGEAGVLSEALDRVGRRAQLFRAMGDLGPGLDLARYALAAGWFEDSRAVEDAGLAGVKAALRVATDDNLAQLPDRQQVPDDRDPAGGPVLGRE